MPRVFKNNNQKHLEEVITSIRESLNPSRLDLVSEKLKMNSYRRSFAPNKDAVRIVRTKPQQKHSLLIFTT